MKTIITIGAPVRQRRQGDRHPCGQGAGHSLLRQGAVAGGRQEERPFARRFLRTLTNGPRAFCTPSPWTPICSLCRAQGVGGFPGAAGVSGYLQHHPPHRRPGDPASSSAGCADYALADYPNHLSLFISAPMDVRVARVAKRQNVTPEKAPPADRKDRQAPGVLLRVLLFQEMGQCGQLPLLHRLQLSGPGPDRGADPDHGGPHRSTPSPAPRRRIPLRRAEPLRERRVSSQKKGGSGYAASAFCCLFGAPSPHSFSQS